MMARLDAAAGVLLDRIQRLVPAPDGGDDFVWIGGPGEGLRFLIVFFEEADRGLQVGDGSKTPRFRGRSSRLAPPTRLMDPRLRLITTFEQVDHAAWLPDRQFSPISPNPASGGVYSL
jgi:hypothetical protein